MVRRRPFSVSSMSSDRRCRIDPSRCARRQRRRPCHEGSRPDLCCKSGSTRRGRSCRGGRRNAAQRDRRRVPQTQHSSILTPSTPDRRPNSRSSGARLRRQRRSSSKHSKLHEPLMRSDGLARSFPAGPLLTPCAPIRQPIEYQSVPAIQIANGDKRTIALFQRQLACPRGLPPRPSALTGSQSERPSVVGS